MSEEQDVNDWTPKLPAPSIQATRNAEGDRHFHLSGADAPDSFGERYRIEVVKGESS